MLTARYFKRAERDTFQTSGHGSCYPDRSRPTIDVQGERVPSEFAKELIKNAKNSVEAQIKKHLKEGRYVIGFHAGKRCEIWLDHVGNIQFHYTFDPNHKG